MSNVTSLRMRVLPRFPARITADNGLTIERDNLDLVLKPDFGSLMKVPSVQGADATYFWAWNEQQDAYSSISFQNLVSNIQDVIIGENLAGLDAVASGLNRVPVFVDDEGNATTYTVSDYFQSVSGSTNAAELMQELGALPADRLPITDTRNGMEAIAFPAGMNSLETRGYAVMGDGGGAHYVRVASEPATGLKVRSVDRFLPNGSVDAANGGWWEIAEPEINVKMAGAGVGGDDTVAFSRAAKAAKAAVNLVTQNTTAVPRADMCVVYVPDGYYTLSELVDVGNRDVLWNIDKGARVVGVNLINGQVTRPDQRATKAQIYGTTDYATGWSVIVGGDQFDRSPAITGVANTGQLSGYADRDKCGLFVGSRPNPPLAETAGGVYSANTVSSSSLSADQLKLLRRGMIIDTKHSTRWTGILDAWNADGSVLTVVEWRPAGGTEFEPLPAGIPDNGTGFKINAFTKLWGQNTAVHLTAEGSERQLIGHEYSIYNTRGESSLDVGDPESRVWGVLSSTTSATGSYFKSQSAFVASGSWHYGFVSRNQDVGFFYNNVNVAGTSFKSRTTGKHIVAELTAGNSIFELGTFGDIIIGQAAASGTRRVDFRTSGNSLAYDYRIEVTGGTTGVGNATVRHLAIDNAFGGVVRPSADNVRSLGTASARWTQVYAVTATINTSDERSKQDIGEIPDEWLDAWGDVKWSRFRWKDAVEEKGDNARWHVGLIAQQVERAFSVRGIDAFAIGLLCRDPIFETVLEDVEEDRPVFEDRQQPFEEDFFDGEKIVRKTIFRTIQYPKYLDVPVFNENGDPVFEMLPVDGDGEGKRELVPLTVRYPVTEKVIVPRPVERETGEFRYGLRYTEAFAIEAAWVRRELSRSS
ncbi:tail fiber domain-containing protein [Agrobacterium tumefaciens]|uniref:tail fiber domain-containing protein n=1 Tax=Agrobacterium tumefaciens TaxID=358 RepID=UPI003BA199E6